MAGQNGTNGEDGAPGQNGVNGANGAQGPKGDPGQNLVAVCPEGSDGLTFNGRLMYCARKLVLDTPQTWVQCLDECLQVGLFLAKEPDLAVICLADPNFFTEVETVGEDVANTPGTCDDGVDNDDADGLADCLDPACALALNCDVDTRYHFESVDPSAGSLRLNPLARVALPGDSVNLCEEITAFQTGDQTSASGGTTSRLLLMWNAFEEAVASSFADEDANLSTNANPRRCLCGKRL